MQKCCPFPIFNHRSNEYWNKQTNHANPPYRTTRIINASALVFSYTESHVPHNNANKSFSYVNKVPMLFSPSLPLCQLRLHSMSCLILRFHEMSKPGEWYNYPITLKCNRRMSITTSDLSVQFQSDRSIFTINIAASILQRLEANCLQTATAPQGGTQKRLRDPFPPPSHLRPASATPKWKYTT